MMMSLVRRFIAWLLRWRRGSELIRTVYLQELPEVLHANTLYVLGEGQHRWSASMLCPCGCGELLQVSLMPEGRPRWHLARHADGSVSLHPSVWRNIGCRSHFFFRNSRIVWCTGAADPGICNTSTQAF